jgi:hypothetical protein
VVAKLRIDQCCVSGLSINGSSFAGENSLEAIALSNPCFEDLALLGVLFEIQIKLEFFSKSLPHLAFVYKNSEFFSVNGFRSIDLRPFHLRCLFFPILLLNSLFLKAD